MSNLKPINTILFLSGAITKGAFSANEICSAVKQFQNGDVIPVIDTLTVLLNGKYEPSRNKSAIPAMRGTVTKLTTGIKSNFKKSGYALALLDIINEAPSIETAALFCEYAKTYSDELKAAYEATKPAKPVASVADMEPAPDLTTPAATPAATLTLDAPAFTLADALTMVEIALFEGALTADQIANLANAVKSKALVAA